MDIEIEDADNSESDNEHDSKKLGLKERISNFFKNPKKRLIFIIVAGLVLIAAGAVGLYYVSRNNATKKTETKEAAKVEKYEAPLDGIMTDLESSKKHPLGVIIENHPDARPQVGLDKASLVYEAIAEGGITRYLALFGTYEADKVGPVRSARTYFVDWAHGYNAYLAHCGGNIDALDKIKADGILDLDQFTYSSAYWREKANVSSEHTLFTSTLKLRDQANVNKYTTDNNFRIYKFKDDSPATAATTTPAATGTTTTTTTPAATFTAANKISVNFSSGQYAVEYNFDSATDSYSRSLAGSPDLDRDTKTQLKPKNVIVMTVKRTATTTRINESGYNMETVGSGKAKIFFDGKAIDGTWRKDTAESREIFYDANNQEVTFNRGQFWICVIPPDGSVTSQ